jgi:hypothetical protein
MGETRSPSSLREIDLIELEASILFDILHVDDSITQGNPEKSYRNATDSSLCASQSKPQQIG